MSWKRRQRVNGSLYRDTAVLFIQFVKCNKFSFDYFVQATPSPKLRARTQNLRFCRTGISSHLWHLVYVSLFLRAHTSQRYSVVYFHALCKYFLCVLSGPGKAWAFARCFCAEWSDYKVYDRARVVMCIKCNDWNSLLFVIICCKRQIHKETDDPRIFLQLHTQMIALLVAQISLKDPSHQK